MTCKLDISSDEPFIYWFFIPFHMNARRCSVCGSEDLVPFSIGASSTDDGHSYIAPLTGVDILACVDCCHIEFYASLEDVEQKIAEKAEKDAKQKAYEEARAAFDVNLRTLESRRDQLNAIISDENQTVKAVKEAEAELWNVEQQLRRMQSSKPKDPFAHRFPWQNDF